MAHFKDVTMFLADILEKVKAEINDRITELTAERDSLTSQLSTTKTQLQSVKRELIHLSSSLSQLDTAFLPTAKETKREALAAEAPSAKPPREVVRGESE